MCESGLSNKNICIFLHKPIETQAVLFYAKIAPNHVEKSDNGSTMIAEKTSNSAPVSLHWLKQEETNLSDIDYLIKPLLIQLIWWIETQKVEAIIKNVEKVTPKICLAIWFFLMYKL